MTIRSVSLGDPREVDANGNPLHSPFLTNHPMRPSFPVHGKEEPFAESAGSEYRVYFSVFLPRAVHAWAIAIVTLYQGSNIWSKTEWMPSCATIDAGDLDVPAPSRSSPFRDSAFSCHSLFVPGSFLQAEILFA